MEEEKEIFECVRCDKDIEHNIVQYERIRKSEPRKDGVLNIDLLCKSCRESYANWINMR